MSHRIPITFAAVALLSAVVAGCGGSAETPITPSSKLIPGAGGAAGQIILSAQGEQRIGLQTAPARAVLQPPTTSRVVIPFSAVVYSPSGRTYAFTNPAPRTFAEVPISVDHISGTSAYLRKGPRAGTRVVTVGAEELFGVQTGVLAET